MIVQLHNQDLLIMFGLLFTHPGILLVLLLSRVCVCIDQKILSQVDSLRRQNLSLEYRNSQLQEVSK